METKRKRFHLVDYDANNVSDDFMRVITEVALKTAVRECSEISADRIWAADGKPRFNDDGFIDAGLNKTFGEIYVQDVYEWEVEGGMDTIDARIGILWCPQPFLPLLQEKIPWITGYDEPCPLPCHEYMQWHKRETAKKERKRRKRDRKRNR